MYRDVAVILDFGTQYNQLIARRVREWKVYSIILPYNTPIWKIMSFNPKAIILTGGPASVRERGAPRCDPEVFRLGIPVLGICYGMQLMADELGGKVQKSSAREYGYAKLIIDKRDIFFKNLSKREKVWMSHGDKVVLLPPGFIKLAHTNNTIIASMAEPKRRLYGVQFHPEVVHTFRGRQIFKNFLYDIAGLRPTWTMSSFIKDAVENIRREVKDEKVILGLSGGVDSSVTAVLLHKAIGKNLHCIFVDNGLLRKYEKEDVKKTFQRQFHINLHIIDREARFLKALEGITNPEKKRKIIGRLFIRIFEEEARRLGGVRFLGQGTLYPDVIESLSAKGGPSSTIKTHHNVGGLPERMGFRLIEPLKELFKDEVRVLGKELGLDDRIIWRQPFPGPGLAVRIIGEVTKERLEILRNADYIVQEEMEDWTGYRTIWQSFAVFLPIKTVGVMGDERTYENVIALRIVTSQDAMTADWARIPYDILGRISNRIINEVKGINRVVYDISSKPPSTIEWE